MPMRIEQLEYLAAVTRHGSLRRASEALHLSQPALSESIRSLEKELGVLLLDRHRTGARISPQGQRLLPRMAEVLDAVSGLRTAADEQRRAPTTVRVGTVNAGTSSLVGPAIGAFARAQTMTSVEVVNTLQPLIHSGLLEGALDVGLVNVLPGDDVPTGLRARRLLVGKPVVCLRADDPLAELDEITVDQLRQAPFVAMRSGYLMHRFAGRLFGNHQPPEAAATDGAENGKSLVAAGAGVTVLPDYSVLGDPLEVAGVLTIRPIANTHTTVTMLALRRADERRATSIDQFEQILVRLAAGHPQGNVD
jgi:DNA-binding transcriptional LysR family regulator